MGSIWMVPHTDRLADVTLRNQLGLETYWKILLTANVWVTPGIQFIHHPSLNPEVDNLVIPLFKFRVAY